MNIYTYLYIYKLIATHMYVHIYIHTHIFMWLAGYGLTFQQWLSPNGKSKGPIVIQSERLDVSAAVLVKIYYCYNEAP